MILSRISKAVREQNWFAVALEFIIVVAGVVIGFMVTGWAERQNELRDEVRILERLHTEGRELLETRQGLTEFRSRWGDALVELRSELFTGTENSLTVEQCRAIAGSHIYSLPPDSLPTLEDLLATGRLDIIDSRAVRESISAYLLGRDSARNYSDAINNQLVRLASAYPDLMPMDLAPSDDPDDRDGFDRVIDCDLAGMRADNGFRNELMDNIARFQSFTYVGIEPLSERLEEMIAAIEAELGIEPQDAEAAE
ncbi:hypothetical protein V0U79_06100 [Hyphobacterium sp. HN65]|uniref:Uncharacterized protein n=1 Tax=Hyphobacterium lacteum TaxID=3116575 RepID=A0ABU7LQL9_9PROT|nr:hypothetical protein [Hyphobacterium sp. HN65]MEE2525931.1 hypothetical protein [Hyphobacterium sp. HN65]